MGCDYLVHTELVIEYYDNSGKICTIHTNSKIEKCYIFQYSGSDSDEDVVSYYKNYRTELEKRIKKKTYTKILFENDKWIKPSYQNKYEDELIETYKEIVKFIKIYKKSTAGESF